MIDDKEKVPSLGREGILGGDWQTVVYSLEHWFERRMHVWSQ